MNITHVDVTDVSIPEDIYDAIYTHQLNLHAKYKVIEEKSGIGFALVKDRPFNYDDRYWQYVLKDMAYRVIEELTEALEARDHGDEVHMAEEEIDALHFMVELLVVIGMPISDNDINMPNIHPKFGHIVKFLGLAGNCLKQKPWKQSPMLTDQTRYKAAIMTAFQSLQVRLEEKFTRKEIYLLYFKKNQVNQFRQRSNY